ncbi:MAG: 2Fe-2S iron-sulfur cluster-binding protein [Geminicoccaceae bacterium]
MISRIRIATGLVLFVFVFFHLINLAFGLISLHALEQARPILTGPWANPVGGTVLLACVLVHAGLGLWSLFQRTQIRLNSGDFIQAIMGVAIIPLLLPHIMATAVAPAITDATPSYTWVLAVYWLRAPNLGMQQVLALMVIWIHACYGLLLWIQVQPWWGRYGLLVYPLALIIPVAALLGFIEAGKEIYFNQTAPAIADPIRDTAALYEPVAPTLWDVHDVILATYAILLAVLILARLIRNARSRRNVAVSYDGGPAITDRSGPQLLELARSHDILHASLCGGRGRCGSCAVRVLEGMDNLPPADDTEKATLARIKAGPDIRLACQAAPISGTVRVERIFPAHLTPSDYRELLTTDDPVEVAHAMNRAAMGEAMA